VYEQIMQALPAATPERVAPWWKRPITVTPMMALAVGAGALAVGLVIGATMLRSR
jgi:hypothetical protein